MPNKIPLAVTAGNADEIDPFKLAPVCEILLAPLVTTTGGAMLNSLAPKSGVALLGFPFISVVTTAKATPELSSALTCGIKFLLAAFTNNGFSVTVLASLLAGVIMAKSIAAIVAASVAFNKPMKPLVVLDKK